MRAPLAALLLCLVMPSARAATTLTVQIAQVPDEKAVFATVESPNVAAARARIGGTVTRLAARQGDPVTQGQVIAVVSDPKLPLQIQSLDAQIAGVQSQLAQTRIDLGRAQSLVTSGTVSRATLDNAATAERVAASLLATRMSERDVARQQLSEGEVLAPSAGRVLEVPTTGGSVVLPGDVLATVAEQDYLLRLSVPERHAQFLHLGDPIRLDRTSPGTSAPRFGKVTLIYPQIKDGRVRVDATAPGTGDYFVGVRVRVWVSAGTRPAIVIPQSFVTTRFGIDFVRQQAADGRTIDVPVQRGRVQLSTGLPDGLEILTGLMPGVVLVQP
jgi:RND family efflux transporter MFP subunit